MSESGDISSIESMRNNPKSIQELADNWDGKQRIFLVKIMNDNVSSNSKEKKAARYFQNYLAVQVIFCERIFNGKPVYQVSIHNLNFLLDRQMLEISNRFE